MKATATSKRVFPTDLPSIERRLGEIERIDKQNALEKGLLLKHVRDNDLTHGQWLSWLETMGIGERTAQRCIQAFEQFGNTTQASGLSISTLFELIQLPPNVDRSMFLGIAQLIPSTRETKFVAEMSRTELREVVRAARDAAGLGKRERPRAQGEKQTGKTDAADVWASLDLLLAPLSPTERETVNYLPLSVTRQILDLSQPVRAVVLDVATKLALINFADHFEEIVSDALSGRSAATISQRFLKHPEPQSLSGILINPYEILGVQYGENEAIIRKRYRELSRKIHPDVGGSAILFKLVNAAYESFTARTRAAG